MLTIILMHDNHLAMSGFMTNVVTQVCTHEHVFDRLSARYLCYCKLFQPILHFQN
jgi:hypothetical protein